MICNVVLVMYCFVCLLALKPGFIASGFRKRAVNHYLMTKQLILGFRVSKKSITLCALHAPSFSHEAVCGGVGGICWVPRNKEGVLQANQVEGKTHHDRRGLEKHL